MLRALVVLLLLANALVLAWSLGALDGLLGRRPDADREPERLQRQVNPELVKLLPPPVKPGASAPAAATSPTSAQPSSSPLLATAAGSTVCLEAGPLPSSAVAGAEKALLAAGVAAGSWTTTAAAAKGVYLIYMGRYEDDETLQRKLEELKRRRIEAHPVRHAELQPGIEVARFEDKEEADAALARLSQRGLRTARVLTLVPPQPQQMLRIAAVEPARAEVLATVKLAPALEGFRRCPPPATQAAAERASPGSGPAPVAAVPAVLGSSARPSAARVRASAPEGGTGGASTAGPPAARRASGGAAAGSATAAP